MVYLSRIYTKTGDKGETGLGDGSRVAKDHPRVTAYGSVDELNSVLGLLLVQAAGELDAETTQLPQASRTTSSTSAAICVCRSSWTRSRVKYCACGADQAEKLEKAIDVRNEHLKPLKSFILPGGTPAAAWCHLARTVCRRAERDVVTLAREEPVNPQVVIYLNRLSDLLFVMSRSLNRQGEDDVLWRPGNAR